MNSKEILAAVKKSADAQTARVIMDALERLSRSLDIAKEEVKIFLEFPPETDKAVVEYKYKEILFRYEAIRIQLHHVYKWLRDGKAYDGTYPNADYQRRTNLKQYYFWLQDKAEQLRNAKNAALATINPELAKKKINRQRSSKPLQRIPHLVDHGETADGFMFK